MMKALLIDADGVVITGRYFSERLSETYGIPLESILPFFQNEFKQCTLGKADLKEELAKYISRWSWKGSIDTLLDFWFSGNSIHRGFMEILDTLRESSVRCYIASDNEKYRAGYLMNEMGLGGHVDGGFFFVRYRA